jgi:hypothetical protein
MPSNRGTEPARSSGAPAQIFESANPARLTGISNLQPRRGPMVLGRLSASLRDSLYVRWHIWHI